MGSASEESKNALTAEGGGEAGGFTLLGSGQKLQLLYALQGDTSLLRGGEQAQALDGGKHLLLLEAADSQIDSSLTTLDRMPLAFTGGAVACG